MITEEIIDKKVKKFLEDLKKRENKSNKEKQKKEMLKDDDLLLY